jgi:hypothetical protein
MVARFFFKGVGVIAAIALASGCADDGGAGTTATGGSAGVGAGGGAGAGGVAGSGGAAGSSGSGGSGATAGSDAGSVDASAGDAPSTGEPLFPDLLWEGVWLIGRREATDRFSWVRFQKPMSQITYVDVMDSTAPGVVGFFECEGKFEFITVPTLSKVKLIGLPAPCATLVELRFFDLGTPADMPAGAELQALIELYGSDDVLVGWRFPSSQCDAAFTTCAEVLP